MSKRIFITLILFFTLIGSGFVSVDVVYAQTDTSTTTNISNYDPLVEDLPYVFDTTGGERTLGTVANGLFRLFFAVAIVLSVLMITFQGMKYLTSSISGSKEDAKRRIREVLFGLLLALGSWLFLSIINPNLISTDLDFASQIDGVDTFVHNYPLESGWYYMTIQTSPDDSRVIDYLGYGHQSNVGFFTEDACTQASEATRNPRVFNRGSCAFFPFPDGGAWFFKYGGDSIIGYFTSNSICNAAKNRFENQNEGEVVRECVQDPLRIDSSINSPGFYVVKVKGFSDSKPLEERMEEVLKGPLPTLESCNDEKPSCFACMGVIRYECLYLDNDGSWYESPDDIDPASPGSDEDVFRQIMNDEDRVQEALDEGSGGNIITNRGWARCTSLGDQCTAVGLLPENAIEGLLQLSSVLPNGATTATHRLVITGGTEFWLHRTHGPNIPIVDLRTKDSSNGNTLIGIDKWVIDNTPQKPGGLGSEEWTSIRDLTIGDAFRPAHNTTFVVNHSIFKAPVEFVYEREPDHWHVIFP